MTDTPSTFNRRTLLLGAGSIALAAACARSGVIAVSPSPGTETAFAGDPVRKIIDAEWRQKLPELSYQVLRHEATERPGTSPLLEEHGSGQFVCLGCDLPLFESKWKFDSHTGWPSFFDKITANIAEKVDADGERTEYHCARCLGHQGHVFDDGPPPTGLRYCNNGAAIKFAPA
jgi:peptide-methionine (R)-S-oxide reductase